MRPYDLVIVGGGTAGIVAARTAAGLGARVVLVERARPGGDCLWTGCVPSKALIAAAKTAHQLRTGGRFGITAGEPRVDFAAVMNHVRGAIARIEPEDSPAALAEAGVELLDGVGHFTDPRTVRVDGIALPFRRALVAIGASPAMPPIPGLSDVDPLTSDTIWEIDELPGRLVVLGGGPVGCELAQAFARLGSEVTVVEAGNQILPKEEARASGLLRSALAADGVRVLTSTQLDTAGGTPGSLALDVSGADGAETLHADRLLVATGRVPSTSQLGLTNAGVRVDEHGHVPVDSKLRTSNQRIYACGDVTGMLPFTHVAGMHGSIAATNAVLAPMRRFERDHIPRVTFTDPELAHIGLTQEQARQRHGRGVRVRTVEHEHVDRAITEDAASGYTQVVLGPQGTVLGASIVAPRAGEMIAELVALVANGGKLRDLSGAVHPYPGWSDAVWHAAVAESQANLRRAPMRPAVRALLRLRRLR